MCFGVSEGVSVCPLENCCACAYVFVCVSVLCFALQLSNLVLLCRAFASQILSLRLVMTYQSCSSTCGEFLQKKSEERKEERKEKELIFSRMQQSHMLQYRFLL